MNTENRNRAVSILEEYFGGALPVELEQVIQGWFAADDKNGEKSGAFESIFDRMVNYDPKPGRYAYNSYEKLCARLGFPQDKRRLVILPRTPLMRVAAVVLPIIAIAGATYFWVNRGHHAVAPPQTAQVTVSVPYDTLGTRMQQKLSDGSRVWVKAGSTIRYADNFDDTREVYLTGEALFEVVHTLDNKPFVVKTDNLIITVLGTRFNVEAYPNRNYTLVTLESGRVVVDSKNSGESITLVPGDELVYDHQSDKMMLTKGELEEESGVAPVEDPGTAAPEGIQPVPAQGASDNTSGQPAPAGQQSQTSGQASGTQQSGAVPEAQQNAAAISQQGGATGPEPDADTVGVYQGSPLENVDMTLGQIFAAIEKHYRVSIEVSAALDSTEKYDIVFSPGERIETVMSVLQRLSGGWKYRIEGSKVTVTN